VHSWKKGKDENSWDKSSTKHLSRRLKRQKMIINKSKKKIVR
jgi:hypothetical protein